MKTNEQTIHAFLKQQTAEGHNTNRSIYFVNNVMYSYGPHYRMAVIRGKTILVNSLKYSVTTSKQCSLVAHMAVQAGYVVIREEL